MTLTRARIESIKSRQAGANKSLLTEEMDALCDLALSALAPATQWRGIESAPKDGTRVQVLSSEVQHTAMFHAGRWIVSKGDGTEDIIITGLTHWQPLPPPPGTEATPPQGESDARRAERVMELAKSLTREQIESYRKNTETEPGNFLYRLCDMAIARLDGIEKGGGG